MSSIEYQKMQKLNTADCDFMDDKYYWNHPELQNQMRTPKEKIVVDENDYENWEL